MIVANLSPFMGGVLILVERTAERVIMDRYVFADATTVQDVTTVPGSVRDLGTSRRVFVQSSSPVVRVVSLSLGRPPKDAVAKIIEWAGKPVYYRDAEGRSIWGVYSIVGSTDDYLLSNRIASLPLEIQELSESRDVG